MPEQKGSVERVKVSLEIDEQLKMHEQGWIAQRAGLVFIFITVVLAAAGVFGDGIASRKAISAEDVLIESERFYRHEARMELKIRISEFSNEEAVISFDNQYLEGFEIESILPEPAENIIEGNMVKYYFPGSGDMTVKFFLIPKKIGSIQGIVRVNESRISLSHFIFP